MDTTERFHFPSEKKSLLFQNLWFWRAQLGFIRKLFRVVSKCCSEMPLRGEVCSGASNGAPAHRWQPMRDTRRGLGSPEKQLSGHAPLLVVPLSWGPGRPGAGVPGHTATPSSGLQLASATQSHLEPLARDSGCLITESLAGNKHALGLAPMVPFPFPSRVPIPAPE